MKVSKNSLLVKLAVPIPLCLCLGLLLAGIFLPPAMRNNAISAASEGAVQTAKQIKILRDYYTTHVIADVTGAAALTAGIDHLDNPAVVPLPATFVHDLSTLLTDEQIRFSLYSPYPFDHRADRPQDDFMEQAWEALSDDPEAHFQQTQVINGSTVLRLAVADQMNAETCVTCHNTIAGSPRTDWELGDLRGVIEVRRTLDPVLADTRALTRTIMIALASVAACLLLMCIAIARSVIRPIDRICSDIAAVSSGQLNTEVEAAQRNDEIGRIGKALLDLQSHLQEARTGEERRAALQQEQHDVVQHLSSGLVRLSRGDFSRPIDVAFSGSHEKLRQNFNQTIETLSGTVSQVIEASESIGNGATEISQASDDLSHRTESQAATLEQTAAALDQMTTSVKAAADGARSVEATMDEAKEEAKSSSEVVANAVAAMTEISDSSSHIGQIITVIDDIAFQTNLLALNARVEAARAGEAGRGFAVVAAEVRGLAQRSSEAAMEIKALIGASAEQVDRGVDLVGKAGEALTSIAGRVNQISELVSDITEGAVEQSTGLAEINIGVTQLDQVTQQNAAMVEQSTAAGHLLREDALKLTRVVAGFQIQGGTRPASQDFAQSPQPASAIVHDYLDWGEDIPAPQQHSTATGRATATASADSGEGKWQDF